VCLKHNLSQWQQNNSKQNLYELEKLQVQKGLKVSVNDLLRMLTGERSIVYRLGWQ